jgi:hypothetical protein
MSDFSFYFKIGWEHIINREALDHIFFIAALAAIYMLRNWKQVLVLVTAFTIGHAITLILSAKDLIEVNSNLVEFLIPCTIVFTAGFNLFLKDFTPKSIRINYFLALFFGLIHGLAFATTLKWLLADDQSFVVAWFSFSVGLELGQIFIVFLILLLAQVFVGWLKLNRRYWVILVSVIVFGLALKMAVERWPWGGKKHLRGAAVINTSSGDAFITSRDPRTEAGMVSKGTKAAMPNHRHIGSQNFNKTQIKFT